MALTERQLRSAVERGQLTRLSQGWYALPGADEEAQRALRLGTRLTCLSAARLHGAWVPLDPRRPPWPHVAVRHGDPLPPRAGVVVHRLPTAGWTTNEPVLPLDRSLDQVLRFHSVETGLMVLESAVDRGLLSLRSAESLLGSQPLRKQGAGLQLFDPRSGSGSETRVRLWLQRRHHQVRCQVSIAHVGRVDLLVGKSLVIEVDSRAHHLADENYAADHRRDLMLHALGFHRLRLTWHQVFDDWPATVRLLKRALSHGWHLYAPDPDARCSLPLLRWAA